MTLLKRINTDFLPEKLFKNDLLDFTMVLKVAGENTGNGGSPRWVFSPTAKGEMFFIFKQLLRMTLKTSVQIHPDVL